MKVLKFGGSSISSSKGCDNIAKIIQEELLSTSRLWVVFSAFSGVTDLLESIAHEALSDSGQAGPKLDSLKHLHLQKCKEWLSAPAQSKIIPEILSLLNDLEDVVNGISLLKECTKKTMDFVRSFGERLSVLILSAYLSDKGITPTVIDSRELIVTDNSFGEASVDFSATTIKIDDLKRKNNSLVCITGYIGKTGKGETTTLGRNGSDYSAAVLAALASAEELQIWTDVDGVMTADPNRVRKAFTIPALSYVEAMELSHFGARVVHARTTQPVMNLNIPIRIKNTFNPDHPGTIIQSSSTGDLVVKGLSSMENIALLNVTGPGMVGVCGIAGRLFSSLAEHQINIILISQASSEHSICIAIRETDVERAIDIIHREFEPEIQKGMVDSVQVDKHKVIVAVVGEQMRHIPGISGKLFQSLGKNGINVYAIAQGSSELNISVVIDRTDLNKALNTIHDAFFLSDCKTANLYLIGPGLIGSTVLELLNNQEEYLAENYNLEISLAGIINTKKMVIDSEGISLKQWKTRLESDGKNANLNQFFEQLFELNLPNAIVLDCTSSEEVVSYYPDILARNIALVTPNKKSNSRQFSFYKGLKRLSARRNVPYLYETNVGAGLPVIQTIRDLIMSGDKINRIEGILSGTLNFIFSEFMNSDLLFSEVVQLAMEKGYTEPHPEDDLNGRDVGRKILILSREAGYEMEPDQVRIENLLPDEANGHLPLSDFFRHLRKSDTRYDDLRNHARENNMLLRYVAKFEGRRAEASLIEIEKNHPFAGIEGSDNIVALYTMHYNDKPLIVQGAGAGAKVTASGVLADVIKAANLIG
ncbi:MAG: bifunctional aspartate kinase/homoserine dehydrogenase I [Calditrichia bacterium]